MTIDHLMRAVRHAAAANGSGALSSGEAITAALVLNRADWLADMGYTIGQALDRIDEGDVELIPRAENCGAPNARATPKSRQLPPALPKWRICSATRQVMSRTIPCTSIPSSSLMGTLRGTGMCTWSSTCRWWGARCPKRSIGLSCVSERQMATPSCPILWACTGSLGATEIDPLMPQKANDDHLD